MYWLAALVVWLVCGVLVYGMAFAQCQRTCASFPPITAEDVAADRKVALFAGLCGPIALAFALYIGGVKYGLKFRTSERKRRCEKQ